MIHDPNGRIVHLELSTYAAIVFAARHYYAELKAEDQKTVELMCVLTASHAAALNKGAWGSFRWTPGDTYRGFLDKQKAIDVAVTTWREHFPNARCLLLGMRAHIAPKPVLALDGASPDTLTTLARLLTAHDDTLASNAQKDQTNDEWEQLLAHNLGLRWTPWQ